MDAEARDDLLRDEENSDAEMKVGEKIKSIREGKGLSLQDLATRSGFSSALVSQLENHLVSPPLGMLIKIARALEIEIGAFFEDVREAPFTIVRHNERKHISRVESKAGKKYGYAYESLAYDKKGRHMEPFLVTLEPATIKESHAYSHEGEEFIFVLEGKVKVQLGDHTDVLEPGDSIYFDSIVSHRILCAEEANAVIVAAIYTGHSITSGVVGESKTEEC